jgi:hypothetical protein
VEDDVDVLGGTHEPVAVADVADEEAHVAPSPEVLALVELLRLVTTEDPDDRRIRGEELPHEAGAHGAGAAGDEDALASNDVDGLDEVASWGGAEGRRAERSLAY